MKLKLLLLFIASSLCSHDVQTAFFTIKQKSDTVFVEMIFETDDIVEALNAPSENISTSQMQTYLEKHFQIEVNDIPYSYRISKPKSKKGHLKCKAILNQSIEKIESIKISNDCLLHIEDHSNIIEIRLNDQERDFLMNKDRTSIQISL